MKRRSVFGIIAAWLASLFASQAKAAPQESVGVVAVYASRSGDSSIWTIYPLSVWGEETAERLALERVYELQRLGWEASRRWGVEGVFEGEMALYRKRSDGSEI